MRCPACGSGNVSLSPSTGALCLACECNFDPKHGLSGGRPQISALDGRSGLERREKPEPYQRGW